MRSRRIGEENRGRTATGIPRHLTITAQEAGQDSDHARWPRLQHHAVMVALTDAQLKTVMTAANAVPVERRGIFWNALPRCCECAVMVISAMPM
ncbi:MAG: hypothetical protein WA697_14195 [Pseudolabrys sp.]